MKRGFTPLPNDRILSLSKLKTFADSKIILFKKSKILLGSIENIAENKENAGYQHFLLFPQCFQKVSFKRSLKVEIVW